jgi:hypothetical protein
MIKRHINQNVIALFPHPTIHSGHFEGGTTEKSFGENLSPLTMVGEAEAQIP